MYTEQFQNKKNNASCAKFIAPKKIAKLAENSNPEKGPEKVESLNDSDKVLNAQVTDLISFTEQSNPLNELICLIQKNKVY